MLAAGGLRRRSGRRWRYWRSPSFPAWLAQEECLYNDAHFHVQDFRAQGIPIPDVVKTMDGNVCRAVMMGLAVTIAHDPVIDGNFAPVYYTQTDGQVLYYNAIQDVLVAHKYLALPEKDRARLDPLMSAFNLKDSRAAEYIKLMVRLYPGVWSGFGEIHFKKQEFSEKSQRRAAEPLQPVARRRVRRDRRDGSGGRRALRSRHAGQPRPPEGPVRARRTSAGRRRSRSTWRRSRRS